MRRLGRGSIGCDSSIPSIEGIERCLPRFMFANFAATIERCSLLSFTIAQSCLVVFDTMPSPFLYDGEFSNSRAHFESPVRTARWANQL